MEPKLLESLEKERETKAAYHFLLGREWRLFGQPKRLHSPLAYAAFEFRCGIERCVIELFALIRDQQFSDDDLKGLERFSSLIQTLLNSQGGKLQLYRKLMFNRIYTQASRAPPEIWLSVPDLGILQRMWTELSEYCHRQLRPKTTWSSMGDEWVAAGYRLLNEVENYLYCIMSTGKIGWVPVESLPPEAAQARQDFLNGRITEADLKTRIELMTPVLENRYRQTRYRK